MEVHAHPHTERKKFTHYLWEFFMLFLAVTAGFFVENQREHYSETKRGKQYIKSFVEDLKIDTARFSGTINYYKKKESELNHLYTCYDSILHNQNATGSLKNIIDATNGFVDLIYTDRTLEQLKNAGGLRLLEEEDADSIIKYDAFLRFVLRTESTSMQVKATEVRNTRNAVFVFSEIMDTTFGTAVMPEKLEMVTKDKELLNRFFNEVLMYRSACIRMDLLITQLRGRAVRLIKFYSEKYHLSEITPSKK
ncbi:MAG TPA: hypothetical protein VET23_13185 [Chitinophagaceae bacterium]|nr:hypothetical protein [Chitinophagaceae bacterium]